MKNLIFVAIIFLISTANAEDPCGMANLKKGPPYEVAKKTLKKQRLKNKQKQEQKQGQALFYCN
jgi:hypothetical protein